MKPSLILLLALVLAAIQGTARAEVRLPALFSDHMVLQAERSISVWGWATPGEAVNVSLAGRTSAATADLQGRWAARISTPAASRTAQTLVIRGTNTLTIRDVLVGEVWLCSGQSNMEMQLKGLHGQVDHADAEIVAADFPQIRMFQPDEVYDIYQLK